MPISQAMTQLQNLSIPIGQISFEQIENSLPCLTLCRLFDRVSNFMGINGLFKRRELVFYQWGSDVGSFEDFWVLLD